jgi:hypothetical protein
LDFEPALMATSRAKLADATLAQCVELLTTVLDSQRQHQQELVDQMMERQQEFVDRVLERQQQNQQQLVDMMMEFQRVNQQQRDQQQQFVERVMERQREFVEQIAETRREGGGTASLRPGAPWPFFHAEANENVRHWIRTMESAFKAHKIADGDRVTNAGLCMKDKAAQWINGLPRLPDGEAFATWEDLCKAILMRFEPANYQRQLRRQLDTMKQTGSVAQYISEYNSVLSQIDAILEIDKVEKFLKGLREDIRYEVDRANSETLSATIQLAENTERALAWSKAQQDGDARPSTTNDGSARASSPSAHGGSGRNGQPSHQRRCYNCNETGHKAYDCPRPRTEQGKNGPPLSKRDMHGKPTRLENNSLFIGNSANLMHLPVRVNGQTTMALVDPGSTDSYIDERFAARARVKTMNCRGTLAVTMGDATDRPITKLAYRVPMTPVEITHAPPERLDCAVMPLSNRGLILGMQWLSEHKADINYARRVISLDYGGKRVTLYPEPRPRTSMCRSAGQVRVGKLSLGGRYVVQKQT